MANAVGSAFPPHLSPHCPPTISIPYSSKLKSHLESLISCLSNLYEENKLKLAALGHIQLPTLKRTCVYKHTQLGEKESTGS